jgi:hypothetical protein
MLADRVNGFGQWLSARSGKWQNLKTRFPLPQRII